MEFVDVKVTIDVSFGIMTEGQYNEFVEFFKRSFNQNKQIENNQIIDFLALDKRPFFVSEISGALNDDDHEIKIAKIELKC